MAKHINIKDKKKFLVLVVALIAVIVAVVVAFAVLPDKKAGETPPPSESATGRAHEETVLKCIDALKENWKSNYDKIDELYANGTFKSDGKANRLLEIKNVRVITVNAKDDPEYSKLKYVVEFDLYSNRYRTEPYLTKEEIFNTVEVYENGDVVVKRDNLFNSVLFADSDSNRVRKLASKVEDLGDIYNTAIDLD